MHKIFILVLLFGFISACTVNPTQDSTSQPKPAFNQKAKKDFGYLVENKRYWTVFNTGFRSHKGTGLQLSLPPGALVIKAPQVEVDVSKGQREYELISTGYNFSGTGPSEMHITMVLVDVGKYGKIPLDKLSQKMQSDRQLFFHNSHLSWFKNPGRVININNDVWLHRIGRSTGASTKSRLKNKSEDAYLLRLDGRFVLVIYGTYYDTLKKNPGLDKITRKIVENIHISHY